MSKRLYLFDKLLTLVCQYDFQDDEEIRAVKNYNNDGRYYVSNYGKVFTLHYNRWKEMQPFRSKRDGHLYIKLYYDGQRISRGIHQLVAESFLTNSTPEEKTQIHNIGFNPLNNSSSNLVYVSPKEHNEIHYKHDKELAEKRLKEYASRKDDKVSS